MFKYTFSAFIFINAFLYPVQIFNILECKYTIFYYITIYNKLFYYYFFSFVNFASDFHA